MTTTTVTLSSPLKIDDYTAYADILFDPPENIMGEACLMTMSSSFVSGSNSDLLFWVTLSWPQPSSFASMKTQKDVVDSTMASYQPELGQNHVIGFAGQQSAPEILVLVPGGKQNVRIGIESLSRRHIPEDEELDLGLMLTFKPTKSIK